MASTRRQALVALGLQGKVDHHDGVLLHDADQQHDADQRDDAEVGSSEQQRQNRADAGRGQRGENRQRMNQAFIQNAEHDVDRDQRGQDQIGLVLERVLKGLRGALEGGVDGAGHAHVALGLFERGHRIAQGHVGREIESERDRRILALVIHRERGPLLLIMCNGRERHHGSAGAVPEQLGRGAAARLPAVDADAEALVPEAVPD